MSGTRKPALVLPLLVGPAVGAPLVVYCQPPAKYARSVPHEVCSRTSPVITARARVAAASLAPQNLGLFCFPRHLMKRQKSRCRSCVASNSGSHEIGKL